MDKQHLHDTLSELHEELQHGRELDAESRERLSQLLADIQTVLQKDVRDVSATDEETEEASITDRLQDAVIDFEASYPRFSQLMGRIADGLSQLGI